MNEAESPTHETVLDQGKTVRMRVEGWIDVPVEDATSSPFWYVVTHPNLIEIDYVEDPDSEYA